MRLENENEPSHCRFAAPERMKLLQAALAFGSPQQLRDAALACGSPQQMGFASSSVASLGTWH
jgi:hypothetical protein